MKISRISLKNFKRFSNLVIRDIPEEAKLVLLVGPNGAGKSSLFDGLLLWHQLHANMGWKNDETYYRKIGTLQFDWRSTVDVKFHGNATANKNLLYLRSAYRNDPDFNVSSFSRVAAPYEKHRISATIYNDQAVTENYTRLLFETLDGLYSTKNDEKKVGALREELIGSVRASMVNVFGDLNLNSILDPLNTANQGAFAFRKGCVDSFHYKNLSGGEKAAFDLLLDLRLKARYYDNSVFCIDEPELHMHTRLQGRLIMEMLRIIPNNSQLWLATHSLGVLRAAKELHNAHPEQVCVLDFDGYNFDEDCIMLPSRLDRVLWDKFMSITLDDLHCRVAPELVIICEGSPQGKRRRDFDAEIYNRIFSRTCTDVLFVSGGSSAEVSAQTAADVLRGVLKGSKVVSLIDRDDLSPPEVAGYVKNKTIVTGRRNLESYLFDDEVLETLLQSIGRQQHIEEVLALKKKAIEDSTSRGNAADDMKSAAGSFYVELKRLLNLKACGSNRDAFLRDTLAPLIQPGMSIYLEMEQAIIDAARHLGDNQAPSPIPYRLSEPVSA